MKRSGEQHPYKRSDPYALLAANLEEKERLLKGLGTGEERDDLQGLADSFQAVEVRSISEES